MTIFLPVTRLTRNSIGPTQSTRFAMSTFKVKYNIPQDVEIRPCKDG